MEEKRRNCTEIWLGFYFWRQLVASTSFFITLQYSIIVYVMVIIKYIYMTICDPSSNSSNTFLYAYSLCHLNSSPYYLIDSTSLRGSPNTLHGYCIFCAQPLAIESIDKPIVESYCRVSILQVRSGNLTYGRKPSCWHCERKCYDLNPGKSEHHNSPPPRDRVYREE